MIGFIILVTHCKQKFMTMQNNTGLSVDAEVRLRMWFSSLMNKQSGAMAKAMAPLWRSAREFAPRGRKVLRVAPNPNRHPHRAGK